MVVNKKFMEFDKLID